MRDGLRDGGRGVVQDPSGDLGDRGTFHSACVGGVGEGRVPPGGEAETWGEVAGMGLQEGGLANTGDSAKAQVGIDEGPTYEVRSIEGGRWSVGGRVWWRG